MTLRVVVTGDRNHTDKNPIMIVLEGLRALSKGDMLLVEGGAIGVDEIARKWAKKSKIQNRRG